MHLVSHGYNSVPVVSLEMPSSHADLTYVFSLPGKDRIIFVTKEDHEAPSNAELIADDPNDPYEDQGLILPSGEINWNCPCLGGMASGPCGTQFKEAFSCFHYSNEEVKGSECIDNFRAMQECMQKYPELYPQEDENEGADAAAPSLVDSTASVPTEDSSPASVPSSNSTPSPPTPESAPSSDNTPSTDSQAAS